MKYSLGTVCELKNNNLKIIIIGYNVKSPQNPEYLFNYVGCLYPEGYINSNKLCYFNDEHIDKIIFNGYIEENDITKDLNVESDETSSSTSETQYKFDENGFLIEVIPAKTEASTQNNEPEVSSTEVQITETPTLTSIDISDL